MSLDKCEMIIETTALLGSGGGGVTVYTTEAELLAAAGSVGDLAFATDTDTLYIYCSTGWQVLFACPPGVGTLAGVNLASSVIPADLFSAILPSGLAAAWYACGGTPGDTVTNLLYNNAYVLTAPDATTRFAAGPAGNTDGGNVTHVLNGTPGDTRPTSAGVGSTGVVEITDLTDVGTTQKANAQLNIVQAEGCASHVLRHDGSTAGPNSGDTNAIEYYHDDANPAPTFSVAPAAAVNTAVDKFLSGIAYLDTGSTIDVTATAADAFNKAYHPTAVGLLSGPGVSGTQNLNPGAVPAFNDPFAIAETVTLGAIGSVVAPQWQIQVQKPDGTNVSAMTTPLTTDICAGGSTSTPATDSFDDEDQRLTAGLAAWDSTTPLVDGEAQVFCGALGYPSTTDYPGFVLPSEYLRRIVKATASNGTLNFSGLSNVLTQVSQYLTGDLNVLLHLENDNQWFDLGLPFGAFNGTGDGLTRANSLGGRNDGASSGSLLAFTFGVFNTALNNNRYEIYIIFNNNTHTLTNLVGA